jgi:hypothetical protein
MVDARQIGGTTTRNLLPVRIENSLKLTAGPSTCGETNSFRIWRKGVLARIPADRRGGSEIAMDTLVEAFVEYYRISEAGSTRRDRTPGWFHSPSLAMATTVPRLVRLPTEGTISQHLLGTNGLSGNWDMASDEAMGTSSSEVSLRWG